MNKKPAKKRKRLVKGRHYDAWAVRYEKRLTPEGLHIGRLWRCMQSSPNWQRPSEGRKNSSRRIPRRTMRRFKEDWDRAADRTYPPGPLIR